MFAFFPRESPRGHRADVSVYEPLLEERSLKSGIGGSRQAEFLKIMTQNEL